MCAKIFQPALKRFYKLSWKSLAQAWSHTPPEKYSGKILEFMPQSQRYRPVSASSVGSVKEPNSSTVQKEISHYALSNFLHCRDTASQMDLPFHLGFAEDCLCQNVSARGTAVTLPWHHSPKIFQPKSLIQIS